MTGGNKMIARYSDYFGYISGGDAIRKPALNKAKVWCMDNGMFTGVFKEDKWLMQLELSLPWKSKCAFVAIPDVIGNAEATIDQFVYYRNKVTGYPIAFVTQDGIREHENKIPWDDFDAIFVGGTDKHKLGVEGRWVIEEAKKRDKWIHIGRVNSYERIMRFHFADSWDGTHLKFQQSDARKFASAVKAARLTRLLPLEVTT